MRRALLLGNRVRLKQRSNAGANHLWFGDAELGLQDFEMFGSLKGNAAGQNL